MLPCAQLDAEPQAPADAAPPLATANLAFTKIASMLAYLIAAARDLQAEAGLRPSRARSPISCRKQIVEAKCHIADSLCHMSLVTTHWVAAILSLGAHRDDITLVVTWYIYVQAEERWCPFLLMFGEHIAPPGRRSAEEGDAQRALAAALPALQALAAFTDRAEAVILNLAAQLGSLSAAQMRKPTILHGARRPQPDSRLSVRLAFPP